MCDKIEHDNDSITQSHMNNTEWKAKRSSN